MRARRALCVHQPPRFSLIATPQTLTAATAAMQPLTKGMELSMALRRSLSSRVSSVAHLLARRLRLLLLPRRLPPVLGHALRCMDNVVARAGPARHAALLEPVKLQTLTILNACKK